MKRNFESKRLNEVLNSVALYSESNDNCSNSSACSGSNSSGCTNSGNCKCSTKVN